LPIRFFGAFCGYKIHPSEKVSEEEANMKL